MDLIDYTTNQCNQGRITSSNRETATEINVLLVDDSDEFISSMKRFLSYIKNIKITRVARSGKEGLAAIQVKPADLVLMDIMMQPMNGFEATKALKKQSQYPKVIIVSLYDSKEYQSMASLAHADGFVSKSKIGTDLIPMIQKLFPMSERAVPRML
jgi:DNA-binding NarL/FixJ family response regulator